MATGAERLIHGREYRSELAVTADIQEDQWLVAVDELWNVYTESLPGGLVSFMGQVRDMDS